MRFGRAWALKTIFCSVAVWMSVPLAAHGAGEPLTFAGSAGRFGLLRGGAAFEAGAEMRFAPRRLRLLPRVVPGLRLAAGGMATSRGTLYVYSGFRFDLPVGSAWRVSPQTAVGFYHQGDGKDLGGAIEFRSGLELSRRIGARSRLGILFYHLSNAGIYERNPGTESLVLTYSREP